jgi:hypothetical protein
MTLDQAIDRMRAGYKVIHQDSLEESWFYMDGGSVYNCFNVEIDLQGFKMHMIGKGWIELWSVVSNLHINKPMTYETHRRMNLIKFQTMLLKKMVNNMKKMWD